MICGSVGVWTGAVFAEQDVGLCYLPNPWCWGAGFYSFSVLLYYYPVMVPELGGTGRQWGNMAGLISCYSYRLLVYLRVQFMSLQSLSACLALGAC
jgi:hypothetical protein